MKLDGSGSYPVCDERRTKRALYRTSHDFSHPSVPFRRFENVLTGEGKATAFKTSGRKNRVKIDWLRVVSAPFLIFDKK